MHLIGWIAPTRDLSPDLQRRALVRAQVSSTRTEGPKESVEKMREVLHEVYFDWGILSLARLADWSLPWEPRL